MYKIPSCFYLETIYPSANYLVMLDLFPQVAKHVNNFLSIS